MNGLKGELDRFRVEEVYNWRDDIMEITRQIIHETDEARLNNIAEHFEVDLSEIREFLEMKRKKMQKPQTNADKIRSMTDEELARLLYSVWQCEDMWYQRKNKSLYPFIEWLKQEVNTDG